MQDGIIKGTGNSRYLRGISNFLQQYPTYQDFVAALVAGTLPIDLNGINETGWDQLGTALSSANILSAITCAFYGEPVTAVPNDIFLHNTRIERGSYVGNGAFGSSAPNTLTFTGNPLLLLVIGTVGNQAGFLGRGSAATNYIVINTSANNVGMATWTGKSVSWWATNAASQFNGSGQEYRYLAFTIYDEV